MVKSIILKSILFLLVFGLFLIIGCSINQEAQEEGDLVLNIAARDMNTKTILPELEMTVATYDVKGTGPEGQTFEHLNVIPGEAVVQSGLRPGTWTITVKAKNSDPTIIGEGSTVVEILPGKINQATVIVYPAVGVGTLDLTITWPNYPVGVSIMNGPQIVSTLTPVDGGPESIDFEVATDKLSASYTNDNLSNGYYKLSIMLYEGDTSKPENKVWGTVEAARIIAGQTSSKTYSLKDEIGLGFVEITVKEELENPLTVTFSGSSRFLLQGNNMTITATVTDENGNSITPDSYEWYLDGELLINETDNTITIGESLAPDTYYLDLVVTKGNIISSSTVVFEIVTQDQKLLFVSDRDGDNEIFATNADTSNFSIQITSNTFDDTQPAWSPDLSRIAFISNMDGNPELYVMDSDGTNITRLTTNTATEKSPAWSPDGTKIAFVSDIDGNDEIYWINADGGAPTQVTITDSGINKDPTWSPDESNIAYTSTCQTHYDNEEIFVINSNGTGTPYNFTNFLANDRDPSWSPDGTMIAFVSDRDGNKEIYYLLYSSPNTLKRLTNNSYADESPVWSPSGDKIAFSSNRDVNNEIYVMNSDGTVQSRVTDNAASDIQPEW